MLDTIRQKLQAQKPVTEVPGGPQYDGQKIDKADTSSMLGKLVTQTRAEGVQGVEETSDVFKGKTVGKKRGKLMLLDGDKWRYMTRREREEYKGSR